MVITYLHYSVELWNCNSCCWFADSEIAKQLRDEVEQIQRQQQNLYELYQEYCKKGQELKKEKLVCFMADSDTVTLDVQLCHQKH